MANVDKKYSVTLGIHMLITVDVTAEGWQHAANLAKEKFKLGQFAPKGIGIDDGRVEVAGISLYEEWNPAGSS